MKKHCFFIVSFFLNHLLAFPQDYTDYSYLETAKVPEKTDERDYYGWKITAGKDIGFLEDEWIHGFSARLEFYAEKHFSIHWGFGYARRGEITHVHVPLGIGMWSVGTYERQSDTSTASPKAGMVNTAGQLIGAANIFGFIGLLALTIMPEGFNFHFYPNDWLTISPYINPFALDYTNNKITGERRLPYTPSIGSRFTLFDKNILSLSLFVEARAYTKIGIGCIGGFTVSCKLNPY